MRLYEYQKQGVKRAIEERKFLISDQMGLGKSVQALSTIQRVGGVWLIVAPAYLLKNWNKEIKKFIPDKDFVLIRKGKDLLSLPKSELYLCSYSFSKYFKRVFKGIKGVVLEECQAIKNANGKTSKEVVSFVKDIDYTLMLSGTPILNRVDDLYPYFLICPKSREFLESKGVTSLTRYRLRYFTHTLEENPNGGKFYAFHELQRMDEIRNLLSLISIRRLTSEVLDLPPLIEEDYNIRVDGDKELWETFQAFSRGGVDKEHIMRRKSLYALSKVSFTLDLVKQLIRNGEKVLVFSDHVKSNLVLYEGLVEEGFKGARVDGSVDKGLRFDYVEKINGEDDFNFITATISSFCTGFNVTTPRIIVFNDESWVHKNNEQAIGRVYRNGQLRTVIVYKVRGGKMDSLIGKHIKRKENEYVETYGK